MEDKKLRQKLIELGVEELADALLELASRNETAADFINHIVATPEENIKRFSNKLRSLRRSQRFIGWRESQYFAQEIETLLEDLKAGVEDPEIGVKLLCKFYESDSSIFESCDDSSGWVGTTFTDTASELFADYARKCGDKSWIMEKLCELYTTDNYGVRFCLIEKAYDYFSKEEMYNLVERLRQESQKSTYNPDEKRHWLYGIKSLAEQLKDAQLYENTYRQMWSELSMPACLDIAKIYLESGDAATALSWLERIKETNHIHNADKDNLLLAVYKQLGKQEDLVKVAWRCFNRYRSEVTLNELISILGEDKRAQTIEDECSKIHAESRFSLTSANFMIQVGRIDDADRYFLTHREELDGDSYYSLLPLAKSMEDNKRYLSASLIYRALLESILRRAQSKYYHHGVKYLNKLDELSLIIKNWQDILPHQAYYTELHKQHYRKVSFWSKYKH